MLHLCHATNGTATPRRHYIRVRPGRELPRGFEASAASPAHTRHGDRVGQRTPSVRFGLEQPAFLSGNTQVRREHVGQARSIAGSMWIPSKGGRRTKTCQRRHLLHVPTEETRLLQRFIGLDQGAGALRGGKR